MKIKKGLELRNICGENVILATSAELVDFNQMISTNESATFLWKSVSNCNFDAHTLAHLLCQEYEVSAEIAFADSEKILEKWKLYGLVE